jgi:SDR family mycofactocin-dependent oxidoreductase
MGKMDGRVAIVTGGARGQGRAHAIMLAREGACVALVDIAAQIGPVQYPLAVPDDLDETQARVEAQGARCLQFRADVRDRAAIDDMVSQTIAEFGAIDVLVANAGIVGYGTVLEQSHELFDAIVGTCLAGTWNCCRAVLPNMIDRGYGRIIITSSGLVGFPAPNVTPYLAAKNGVVGLMKGLALEVIDKGVTVNVIQPYIVNTPLAHSEAAYKVFVPDKKQPTYADFRATLSRNSLTGVPWIEPERISRAVLFLAEEEASDITGTTVEVPGGWGHS